MSVELFTSVPKRYWALLKKADMSLGLDSCRKKIVNSPVVPVNFYYNNKFNSIMSKFNF